MHALKNSNSRDTFNCRVPTGGIVKRACDLHTLCPPVADLDSYRKSRRRESIMTCSEWPFWGAVA